MFKLAHDVDSAEERFAVALTEFSKLALAPRRVPPHGPQLDARQLELIALAHRALWFGVELRLGDRDRTARGFAAAEMLHGEARAALRREISYAREQHVLALSYDIELGPEPLERSEGRLAEVARSWREAAYDLGLTTFARWLGEPIVLRELVELYGDLLRVVRVTTLPLRADGPDPAYLRSLLTLARTGESGAAPRSSLAHDLAPELRETFRQDATRTAKLSALIALEDSGEHPLEPVSARAAAIARASDTRPPQSKLSALSIDRAPTTPRDPEDSRVRPVSSEERRMMSAPPPPVTSVEPPARDSQGSELLPLTAMFGSQSGPQHMLQIGVLLTALALLAVLAVSSLSASLWFDAQTEPTQQQR
jgi:hypothetical protein